METITCNGKSYTVTANKDGIIELVDAKGREYVGMPTYGRGTEDTHWLSGNSAYAKIVGSFTYRKEA